MKINNSNKRVNKFKHSFIQGHDVQFKSFHSPHDHSMCNVSVPLENLFFFNLKFSTEPRKIEKISTSSPQDLNVNNFKMMINCILQSNI